MAAFTTKIKGDCVKLFLSVTLSLGENSFILNVKGRSATLTLQHFPRTLRWISRAQSKIGLKSIQTVRELHRVPLLHFLHLHQRVQPSIVLYFSSCISDSLLTKAGISFMSHFFFFLVSMNAELLKIIRGSCYWNCLHAFQKALWDFGGIFYLPVDRFWHDSFFPSLPGSFNSAFFCVQTCFQRRGFEFAARSTSVSACTYCSIVIKDICFLNHHGWYQCDRLWFDKMWSALTYIHTLPLCNYHSL